MATKQDEEQARAHEAVQPPTGEAGSVPGRVCDATGMEEPLGGDPPCWAHLFEDDEAEPLEQ